MKVAAVVILFNPQPVVVDNILTYVDQVDRIYVIDNSIVDDTSIVHRLQGHQSVRYSSNHSNLGIAKALNMGAISAIKDGFDWLLTMDQDTSLPRDYVNTLLLQNDSNMDGIGILAPLYHGLKNDNGNNTQNVLWTMTSGNLLNLSAYLSVGPFLDELFIDHVDHEFCLRLAKNGWKILQVNTIRLAHRPGEVTRLRLFGFQVEFSTHSPQRLYYFVRNGFYVSKKYRRDFPGFRSAFRKLLIREFAKIPFQRNRLLRGQLVIRGYLDSIRNALGPLKRKI